MVYVFFNLNSLGMYVVGLWDDSDDYNWSPKTHKILNG